MAAVASAACLAIVAAAPWSDDVGDEVVAIADRPDTTAAPEVVAGDDPRPSVTIAPEAPPATDELLQAPVITTSTTAAPRFTETQPTEAPAHGAAAPTTSSPAPTRTTWFGRLYYKRSHQHEIRSVAPDGSDPRIDVEGIAFPGNISPDGRHLLYHRRLEHPKFEGPETDVWSRSVDGTDTQVLPLGWWNSPRLSPDGTRLAVMDMRGGVLYVADADGTNLRQVPSGEGFSSVQLSWTIDSRHVVLASDRGIESVDVDSGARRMLIAVQYLYADSSPADGTIVLNGKINDRIGTFLLDPDTLEVTELSARPADEVTSWPDMPRWSWDGTRVHFWQTERVDGQRVHFHLVMDLTGRSVVADMYAR